MQKFLYKRTYFLYGDFYFYLVSVRLANGR